jgi:hypothetical protein
MGPHFSGGPHAAGLSGTMKKPGCNLPALLGLIFFGLSAEGKI